MAPVNEFPFVPFDTSVFAQVYDGHSLRRQGYGGQAGRTGINKSVRAECFASYASEIYRSMNTNFKAFENTVISKIFYIPPVTSITCPTI